MRGSEHSPPEANRTANLQWDDQGRPVSAEFDDVYFSKADGLEETRYVFLQHNHLAERWGSLKEDSHFVIGETGFGTGLNFLAAWELWQQTAPTDAQLHFVSVERFPLTREDLTKALALWPSLSLLSESLLAAYPAVLHEGFHRLQFAGGKVQLTLIINEASAGFSHLLNCQHPLFAQPHHKIDAWFLDGFAPSKNPDMWSDNLFELLAQLSHPGTTAATFTCAGVVKRGLKNASFAIEKVPGFGHKREMLRARLEQVTAPPAPSSFVEGPFNSPYPAPWWAPTQATTTEPATKHALVIGGGLAGSHTAHALAIRGWQVTLLEARPELAQEGSGNPQGVLYAKLSHRAETLSDFNLLSLQFAQRFYRELWPTCGLRCGVLQLAQTDTVARQQTQLMTRLGEQQLVQLLNAPHASQVAGTNLPFSALWFPDCGWLEPAAACQWLTRHPAIQVKTNAKVEQLVRQNQSWLALGEGGELLEEAPTVIIATANQARNFTQTQHLPLKPVRGQVSYLTANEASQQLQTVLCGEGYIAPSHAGQHCLGASFGPKNPDTSLQEADHQQNLQRLAELAPALRASFPDEIPVKGRAALRATTPDYLPMVGPAPDATATFERFALLAKNAKASVPATAPTLPGMYLNVGHGSRGICYSPLTAELLASQINGDPPPVDYELIRSLHPARFLIRDIVRSR